MRRILLVLSALLFLGGGEAAAQGAPDEARFIASSAGEVYYPRSCSAWRRLSRANLIGFRTEEEAIAAGYRRTGNKRCGFATAAPVVVMEEVALPDELGGSPDGYCQVAAITDGDTVACADGNRIRLLLIDTPEMDQAPYGMEARQALAALLPIGSVAAVELDVQSTDRYGRTLAYLYTQEGQLMNEEMARQGYALALTYPPNVRHVERIQAAIEEARAAGRGLWSGSAFECAPRDHRAGRCDR